MESKLILKSIRIIQLADDTTLFISDTESLRTVLYVLDIHKKYSGFKLNKDKCEAIWIGASFNFKHKPFGLKWTNNFVKCLGIWMGTNRNEVVNKNANERIYKLENVFKMWCCRHLSLRGTETVIHSLAISQLYKTSSVLFVPKWVIEKVQTILNKFLWNAKKPKIKHVTVIGKLEEEGLQMPHFESKVKSMKLAWIQKLFGG